MNRYLCALFLTIFVLLTMTAGAFADEIPHLSCILTPDEVRGILDSTVWLETGVSFNATPLYNDLIAENPDGVPAMHFEIDDSDVEAFQNSLDNYGNYIVHFVLRSSEDLAIVPIGQYDAFSDDAIALPPFTIPANKDFLIMEYFMNNWDEEAQEIGHWPGSYELIARWVKSFNCIAVPVTDKLKSLLPGFDSIQRSPSMKPGTTLRISMNLYPVVSEEPWKLGKPVQVVSADFWGPWPDPVVPVDDLPQTGDSSSLTLWLALGLMSLLIFVKMRSSVRIAKDL